MSECRFRPEVGRYLLGMLHPAVRAEFETHLRGCQACRSELVEMAALPGLLQHLRSDEAPEAPDLPEDRTGAALPRESGAGRRRAVLPAAAAVLVVLGLVVALVVVLLGGHPPQSTGARPEALAGRNTATGVSASATLTAASTGTLLELNVHGLPTGLTCELVARTRDTPPEAAAWWWTSSGSDVRVPGTASVAPYDITRLDVVTAQGQVLVSLPGP